MASNYTTARERSESRRLQSSVLPVSSQSTPVALALDTTYARGWRTALSSVDGAAPIVKTRVDVESFLASKATPGVVLEKPKGP